MMMMMVVLLMLLMVVLTRREVDLFELVLEYGGEDYFDQDRTSPFRYAMVLSCCQRFGDAISHLWSCNRMLPAVQLTAVALHYGLILPHTPLCCNPAHPMLMGRRFLAGGTVGLAQEPTPATVLQSFVNAPQLHAHPCVCTDYLVSLDSYWLQQCQGLPSELRDNNKLKSQSAVGAVLEAFVSSLDRQQLAEVVGVPVDDASDAAAAAAAAGAGAAVRGTPRTPGGRLEHYMSSKQIDQLLLRAAYHLVTQRGEAEAAVYLYLLAGRYSVVVEELCVQLCNTLVPPAYLSKFGVASAQSIIAGAAATDRTYWRSISESFISRYLLQQQNYSDTGSGSGSEMKTSRVLFVLLQGGNTDAVEALKLLTNLFEFVDVAVGATGDGGISGAGRGASAADALNFLDQLNILPAHQDQVNDCSLIVSTYCRPVLDDVLLMAADLTNQAFHALKAARSAGVAGPAAAMMDLTTDRDLRLRALKERARGLSAFAHKLNSRLNRQETPGIVARIEATLI